MGNEIKLFNGDCIEVMTGCEEWEIREREQEYIDALLTTSEYELINKYEETVIFNKNIK